VNKMVQMQLERREITRVKIHLDFEIAILEQSLTGGQMAEVKKILDECR
jgi:hypothetical protein